MKSKKKKKKEGFVCRWNNTKSAILLIAKRKTLHIFSTISSEHPKSHPTFTWNGNQMPAYFIDWTDSSYNSLEIFSINLAIAWLQLKLHRM